jgi:glycosidase
MSPSSPPAGRFRLDVVALPGTEIAVQDGLFRVVENGRGVGRWGGELDAGIYKVRLRTGQALREEHIVLDRPVVRDFRAEPLRFASAAPLYDTAKTHEYQVLAARTESRVVHHRAGAGAQVFVLVRDWAAPGARHPRVPDPAAGLALVGPRGAAACDLRAAARKETDPNQDPWAACNVEVDPGEYRLRLDLPTGPLAVAVVAPPGWQTLVFAMLRDYPEVGPAVRRADLNEMSVLMARPGTFDPAGDDFRLDEVARLALAHDRRRALADEVRDRLLGAKFENPMFGLFGAYLFLRAEVRRQAAEWRRGLKGGASAPAAAPAPQLREFEPVVANLRRLVGPHHPDVEALAETVLPGSSSHTFAAPPMLRASWEAVVRATARRPELVPAGSTADRAADRVFGSGPWLVWADRPGAAPRDAGGLESFAVGPPVGGLEPGGAGGSAPPDAAALVRFLEAPRDSAAPAPADARMAAAVAALGLPRARVESLMTAVARDQDRLRSVAGPEAVAAFKAAAKPGTRSVTVGGQARTVPTPFPSPADWRDQWIYFLMLDRFHNPTAPPRHAPWDGPSGGYQGGTFNGVREKLRYIKDLGAGAVWLSPVLKNRASDPSSFHGYGIQNFLRVEPRFASAPGREEDELRALVDEAHALGLYVILDVVLNHAGDVFEYDGLGPTAPWSDTVRTVRWRDSDGQGRRDWPAVEAVPDPLAGAVVWPAELQRNEFFRRRGKGGEDGGDFESLKELVTEFRAADGRYPVRDALIRSCQYLIARFDVDGFRVDTLKYIEREFARAFGNALREYALSVGKMNFFTFGEVYDDEERIARFIGRNTADEGDLVGVDAALDFPLFYRLPGVAKGLAAPSEVVGVFRRRKDAERDVLSSHGDASRYFVTFLDNHDQHARFRYAPGGGPSEFDPQVPLGVGLLMTLQGIPCVYYGTEQGLHGSGDGDAAVREALWGKGPTAFDTNHAFYRAIAELSGVRAAEPALRYGRQYFRPISGDGGHFGVSATAPGVLAFSRILNDREVVVVANAHTHDPWSGHVIVDAALNPAGSQLLVLHGQGAVGPVSDLSGTEVHETDGAIQHGTVRAVRVTVGPMGLLILAPPA